MTKTFFMYVNGEQVKKEMTHEMAMKQFVEARNKFAHRCNMNLLTLGMDIEDFQQIGDMVILYAYDKYDIEKGACFSTLVTNEFKSKYSRMVANITAQKRGGGETDFLSINDDSDEAQSSIEKFLGEDENGYEELENNELFQQVVSMLNTKELKVFPVILGYIGLSELSRQTGIPRMTLHRRIEALRIKLQKCQSLVVA